MSTSPDPLLPKKENWGSKFGVILAVAGSAVGLGNFLRFPGQAVNNGGGAFMIPYIISFLVLGIPIAWCEWTMGRLGGRYHQNSAPGIMYALWRRGPSKAVGAMTVLIPVVIYMYYVLLEAWCLDYCIVFAKGGFAELFSDATTGVANRAAEVDAVVGATNEHFVTTWGFEKHGDLFHGSRMVWLVLFCFLVNFFVIYHGVTRGIETFCKWAMPALILCAIIILCRVLTLRNISSGLGFMWNPQWAALKNPQVWLAASGQIFFSLSVGFGLILCYSSYLRANDDVVLTALSASSANEFCEVILGGLIVVPTAFLFLGAEAARSGTFGLGFVTVPAIMHFMPGGQFFGALWFGLLFLAAVTSSLSMIQPAIAFLEDGFGLKRRASVALLGVITAFGTAATMYFSRNALALDYTDFWCNLMMIVAATFQVIIFGWVIGAERGVREMNRGADLPVPRFMPFMIRYVTPAFLLIVLGMWAWQNLPGYVRGMSPETMSRRAARTVYSDAVAERYADQELTPELMAPIKAGILGSKQQPPKCSKLPAWLAENVGCQENTGTQPSFDQCVRAIEEHFAEVGMNDEAVQALAAGLLGPESRDVAVATLPDWLTAFSAEAGRAGDEAAADANVARFVFLGILIFFILLVALSDLACRNRIGKMIEAAESAGAAW